MTGQEFFDAHGESIDKVKSLQGQPIEEVIQWENASVASAYSPGVIATDETLLRQIMSPGHYDIQKGQLTPTAVGDVANKGLSTDREKFADLDAVVSAGRARQAQAHENNRPNVLFVAVARLSCAEIRQVVETEIQKRSFVVLDSATATNTAHADVCQLSASSKAAEKAARSILLDLLQKDITHRESINPV